MSLFIGKLILTVPVAYALVYSLLNPAADAGVFRELNAIGPTGGVVVTLVFLAAVFLYCRDLQRSLTLVKPESRAASPRSVWLMFVLPYNFIEDFFIVVHVAQSLRREARRNEALRPFRSFGLVSGLGWCTAQIVSLIPHELGAAAGLFALPLWGVHWRLIRMTNAALAKAACDAQSPLDVATRSPGNST